jgi:preprotein translocase subunit SecF
MQFMRYKLWYFIFSLLIMIPGIVSLAVYRLKPSIDFTGGTLLEIQISNPADGGQISTERIREIARSQDIEISTLQDSTDNTYLLRTKPIDKDQNEKLQTALGELGEITEKRFETVGPTIGAELTQKAFWSVIVATVAIISYIAWSFRHVPKPYSSWKFGVSAIAALIHDVVVVVGVFSILGHFLNVEVDSLFITALLTVIGFSVHDTIVVFDRIRENLPKMPKKTIEEVVDFSIGETLVRSLNTSFTIILTLTSLLLFGGESIRWFVLALLIGVVSGTYSSIFNAAPLLAVWEGKKRK